MTGNKTFVSVYDYEPEGFESQVGVVACYLEIEELLLLLESSLEKSEPGAFGVPAGKLEAGESLEKGAKRELLEETAITAPLYFLGTLYIRKYAFDYTYHLFKVLLDDIPIVKLSDEHTSYKWASKEDIKNMPLMKGSQEALQKYYSLQQERVE